MNQFQNTLLDKAKQLDIELDQIQLEKFEQYYHFLIETNKVMNLTAITEEQEVIDKHFIDSLSLVKCKNLVTGNEKIIDIGTGAGFPGIPLKIAFPELKITLLDSLNKRIEFLNKTAELCDLKDVCTIHGRAEDFGQNSAYREQYDLAVSRAVARLEVLSEYCTPFLHKGGTFISYKSGQCEEELEAASKALGILKCKVASTCKFTLPGTDFDRTLIAIYKSEATPRKYPRKAGVPSKNPIG